MSMNDYSLDRQKFLHSDIHTDGTHRSSLSCLLQVFISGGNMADIKQKR